MSHAIKSRHIEVAIKRNGIKRLTPYAKDEVGDKFFVILDSKGKNATLKIRCEFFSERVYDTDSQFDAEFMLNRAIEKYNENRQWEIERTEIINL